MDISEVVSRRHAKKGRIFEISILKAMGHDLLTSTMKVLKKGIIKKSAWHRDRLSFIVRFLERAKHQTSQLFNTINSK